MKKRLIASALSLATCSFFTQAEHSQDDAHWVGIYGQYYNADGKPEAFPVLDDGRAIGIEAGYRLHEDWAVRFEFSAINVNSTNALLDDQSGQLFGADAMYFLSDDLLYFFGGLKILSLDEETTTYDLGIGKHWQVADKIKIITEVATYQELNGTNSDFGAKLGLAYTFGSIKHSAKPQSNPVPVSYDSDNDGIVDDKDRCPNTPANTKVDNNGCAMPQKSAVTAIPQKDSDGDGVLDATDKCPNTPPTDVVDADGCSRFGEQQISKRVEVLFANDSAEITNPNARDIVEFATFMQRYGKTNAEIEGHASAPGNADYNKQLSERRAKAFLALLVEKYNITPSRLTAVGYGEEQLLDNRNTAEAHRKNRRIVVKVSETVKVKLAK